jgi:rare lipoprotein A (peptidoglycan hydrolase)
VTNLSNGKKVIVTITDDGPHIPGRIIDLSEGAMKAIGGIGSGVVNVKLRVLDGNIRTPTRIIPVGPGSPGYGGNASILESPPSKDIAFLYQPVIVQA